jgi:hypothetical protein
MKEGERAFDHWKEDPLLALLYGILASGALCIFASDWVGYFFLSFRGEVCCGNQDLKMLYAKIQSLKFYLQQKSKTYAKRRFERYMATYQKDLAEGKITLKLSSQSTMEACGCPLFCDQVVLRKRSPLSKSSSSSRKNKS